MNNYGSISVNNTSLLEDLVGLNDDNEFISYLQLQQQVALQRKLDEFKTKSFIDNNTIQGFPYNNNNNNNIKISNNNNDDNNKITSKGRQVLMESPTFAKFENDIYRYVHSRISIVDNMTDRPDNNTNLNKKEKLKDSLENSKDDDIDDDDDADEHEEHGIDSKNTSHNTSSK
jgi:hypothetical protein